MGNMLPFGVLVEMETASFEALCFHTLYVLLLCFHTLNILLLRFHTLYVLLFPV